LLCVTGLLLSGAGIPDIPAGQRHASTAEPAWLNGVFTGTIPPLAPVPAGTVLHIPA
jgi:hypothetical protein